MARGHDAFSEPDRGNRCLGDFRNFVHWISDANAAQHMHFWPQCNHDSTDRSEMGVDFVGHFETIDRDVAHVAERLEILHNRSS